MNRSEYARHLNVHRSYIFKLVKQGKLTPEPDGSIDPDKADVELSKSVPLGEKIIQKDTSPNGRKKTEGFQAGPTHEIVKPKSTGLSEVLRQDNPSLKKSVVKDEMKHEELYYVVTRLESLLDEAFKEVRTSESARVNLRHIKRYFLGVF